MRWFIEPGFWSSAPVQVALAIGGASAVVSAVVGVFTVLRGQSFAGHALTDVSTAGGSGALLLGVSPIIGFVGLGIIGAGVMDAIGVRRLRGRDLATGIVLGASIGLAALILYLDSTSRATTGATQQILFGSIFTIQSSTVPVVVGFGVAALALVTTLYRPLLLSTAGPEMAAARGVPERLVGVLFMAAMAVAVGLSSLTVGAILSTALLIGPAAAAIRLTRRIGWSLALAAVLGVAACWVGVLLAYDSYYWTSAHRAVPVSFFIVSLVFCFYLASGLGVRTRRHAAGRRAGPDPGTPVPGAGAATRRQAGA